MEIEKKLKKIIKEKTEAIQKDIIDWRRSFHQYPEQGFEEYETSKKIKQLLDEFKIPYNAVAGTGVTGKLRTNNKKSFVGIRADMDALPIEEKTGLSFASRNKGVMHACGHDGHIATVLGVARILSDMRQELKGNVKFVFQPCEEKPPGGALRMIKEGAVEDVSHMIGFHYFPSLELKKIWIGKGAVMANTDFFKITVKGKGGHGSAPHLTDDPVVCSSMLINSFQSIVSRKMNPLKEAVLSICKISGGSTFNVIPEKVELTGTVRSLDKKIQEIIKLEIKKKTENICKAFGCKGTIDYKTHSPVVINNPEMSEKIQEISKEILEPSDLAELHPSMGGEDFAYFAEKIPSCYIFVGVGKNCGGLHTANYILNEEILPFTTEYLVNLMFRFTG
jgi:amidohydrolase